MFNRNEPIGGCCFQLQNLWQLPLDWLYEQNFFVGGIHGNGLATSACLVLGTNDHQRINIEITITTRNYFPPDKPHPRPPDFFFSVYLLTFWFYFLRILFLSLLPPTLHLVGKRFSDLIAGGNDHGWGLGGSRNMQVERADEACAVFQGRLSLVIV